MQSHFDIWLLLAASLLSCTIAVLVTISFLKRIFVSPIALKKILLPIFSLVVGTGLWANHILISMALHPSASAAHSPIMLLLAWGFATIIAFKVISTSVKRNFRFSSFANVAVIASMCTLGLYYFNLISIQDSSSIMFDGFATAITLLFTVGVITAINLLLFWIKTYNGKHPKLIKIFTAFIIALSILVVHFAFNSSINHVAEIESTGSLSINGKLMGTIIALSFISLFLLLFIITLIFDKLGNRLFKFTLSSLKSADEQVTYMVDSLTKLPNRKAFEQHLEGAAKRSNRASNTFALAYVDLDHFKPINDQYGHHVGDIVLKTVAERLNTAVRGCDFVARIGGDEFVVIFEQFGSNADISQVAERIVKSIKEPFVVKNFDIELSCSMGIAIYPQDGDLDKLVISADAAMYKAKDEGKDRFKFYDDEIESASDQLLNLQRDLCLALENNEFHLSYLPKIDCKTMAYIGVEALIRWNHPTKGEILPNAFLSAAERFGLINEISTWVVDECCRTIARAKESGINLNVSINLSSYQFRNPNLVKDILKSIKYYDLETSSLIFEIKETLAINNQEQFKLLLDKFREIGIKVVLDDFGLQPISLAYLSDLNIDEIKIHKSFISIINQDKSSKALVDAVIKLAHALDLTVVAEGIENETQRDSVVELGCDYMQGYLFSMPVNGDELFALYRGLQVKQMQIDFGASALPLTLEQPLAII
jgi:diguanylate cyclase